MTMNEHKEVQETSKTVIPEQFKNALDEYGYAVFGIAVIAISGLFPDTKDLCLILLGALSSNIKRA